jgi:hypothetical protein
VRWGPWLLGVGVALALSQIGKQRRVPTPSLLRDAALDVSLAEGVRWGDQAPDTARVDEYLIGVQPHGASLAAENTNTNRINFCAAAVGWAEHQTRLPDLPPWRSGAKQIMFDTQNGARGPNSVWHPVSELASGWRPPPGALAIYHRGEPGAPTGHVDRVVRVLDNGFEAVGANEGGRRWNVAVTSFQSAALLGFVVDGEPRVDPGLRMQFRQNIPVDFVEPLLTPEEERFIRGPGGTVGMTAYAIIGSKTHRYEATSAPPHVQELFDQIVRVSLRTRMNLLWCPDMDGRCAMFQPPDTILIEATDDVVALQHRISHECYHARCYERGEGRGAEPDADEWAVTLAKHFSWDVEAHRRMKRP